MDSYDVDETTARLKSALDINDLVDPNGKGAEFELEDDEVRRDDERDQDTNLNSCYEENIIASNICMVSDGEDDEDDSLCDLGEYQDYLPNETEVLYRKLIRLPNSDITPDKTRGVLKQIKTLGVGSVVPQNSLVRIHYNAYLDVGQAPYDSSRLRGESMKLRLGKGEAVRGLETAILSMRKHEVSRFLIRPDYAYGDMGCPPRIPKRAFIIMDVELIHFVEQEGVDDYYSLTPEERRIKLCFADIEKVVRAENTEGKEYFAMKNYNRAYGKYKKSINILQGYAAKNAAEEKESNKWKVKAFVNCAICSSNLCHFGRVISFCNQALEFERKNVKALYYKGKALHSLGDFGKAEHTLMAARNIDPTNTSVSKALKLLAKSKKDHEVFEKEMCKRMFQQMSSKGKEKEEGTSSSKSSSVEQSVEEEESNECSDKFKEIAQTAIQTFNDDSSRTEMLFPPMSLNIAEITFILETAQSLGLDVRSKGTGNAVRHEIYKKPHK